MSAYSLNRRTLRTILTKEQEVLIKAWRKVRVIEVCLRVNQWSLPVMLLYSPRKDGYAVLNLLACPPPNTLSFNVNHRYEVVRIAFNRSIEMAELRTNGRL